MNVNRMKQITLSLVTMLILTACGGGGGGSTLAGDIGDTTKSIAINSIKAYAENRSNDTPTVQTYLDAGVQGVTSENLTALNNLVDGLEAEDVDTVEEINALAATLGINIVPVAHAQTVTLVKGSSKAITLTATDAEGDALTYMVVSQPAYGTLSGTAPNLTYSPIVNYHGNDSFTFKVNDGEADSEIVTVEITVTDVTETVTMVVKKTGQLLSYDVSGDQVSDGSIKDDGYYQKGVEPSYTRDDATEIVEDHLTGLMWQDNAEAKTITRPWVTQANYDAGNYSDTSGETATTYCNELTLGTYTDWRLPTVVELQGIVVEWKRPSIDTTVFVNYSTSYFYWSSTTNVSYTNYAWNIYFNGGDAIHQYKYANCYVRCVREGE